MAASGTKAALPAEKGSKGATAKPAPGRPPSASKTAPTAPTNAEPPAPVAPASFDFGLQRTYQRTPGWPLFQAMVASPLTVTLFWVSPRGVRKAVGAARLDLSALVVGKQECALSVGGIIPLEALSQKEIDAINAKGAAVKPGGKATPPAKVDKGGKGGKGAPVSEEAPPLLQTATLQLTVSVDKPLQTPEDARGGVILDVQIGTLQPLPPKVAAFAESPPPGNPFSYSLALPLPGAGGAWFGALLSGGPGAGGEAGEGPGPAVRAMWPTVGRFDGGQVAAAGDSGKRIEWESPSVRRYLPAEAAQALKDSIEAGDRFTGEVVRFVKDERVDVLDPFFEKYHAGFVMDLLPFLEGGTDKVDLACPLTLFSLCPPSSSPSPPDTTTTTTTKALLPAPDRPPNKKAKPVDDDGFGDAPPVPPALGGQPPPGGKLMEFLGPWGQAGAQISLSIRFSRPLEPKWVPPPRPELRLGDLIPPRTSLGGLGPPRTAAVAFAGLVEEAGLQLAAEFERLFGGRGGDGAGTFGFGGEGGGEGAGEGEKRREKFVFELNRSGKWFELREKMKQSAIAVVRERCKKAKGHLSKAEVDALYSDLYVFLLDEMHAVLNRLTGEAKGLVPKGVRDEREHAVAELETHLKKAETLKSLADEYEVNGDAELAAKYHQERLVGPGADIPSFWCDYGCFCMRTGDVGKAEECFRSAIACDPQNVPCLLSLGCLFWHRGLPAQTEVLLQSAIDADGHNAVAWALLCVVYESIQRPTETHMCYKEAIRLQTHAMSAPPPLDEPVVDPAPPPLPVFLQAALLLLDLHLPAEAQVALGKGFPQSIVRESGAPPVVSTSTPAGRPGSAPVPVPELCLCLARSCELLGQSRAAEALLEQALAVTRKRDPRAWARIGHLRYSRADYTGAVDAYSMVFRFLSDSECELAIFLRLAGAYAHLQQHNEARQLYLQACAVAPCGATWLGAGMSFFFLGDLDHAEQALAESNVYDNANPRTWAFLVRVCLKRGNTVEAEQALKEALKRGLADAQLLADIGRSYFDLGMYSLAESTLRKALRHKEDPQARLLLAESIMQQNEVDAAKQVLKELISVPNLDDECKKKALKCLADLP